MVEHLESLDPIIEDTDRELSEANTHVQEAQSANATQLKEALSHQHFAETRFLLYQEIAYTLDRDFALAKRISELEDIIAGKSEEVSMAIADRAWKTVKDRLTNLLTKLWADSGHDAMYGRGGKK